MTVNVHLSENKHYLIYDMAEPVTIEELYNAYAQERTLRDEIPHTLHSIVDFSNIRRIPPNWLTAKSGPGFSHPRSGQIVLVGLSTGLQLVMQTITQIVKYQKITSIKTREEAIRYLDEMAQNRSA